MRIPILTYHAGMITGTAYADNGIRALAADLRHVTDRGFTIWPLHRIIATWLEDAGALEGRRLIAFTCDDGTDFDFHDLTHPTAGPQRSVLNVLKDFRAERPRDQPNLNVTSFVVVSPHARAELDKSCLVGRGWWNDDWWAAAAESGLLDIANHSWDHHHDALRTPNDSGVKRGTFRTIATQGLADHEIRQASAYLWAKAPNRGAELFAYPYGETNPYLLSDYFPRNAAELRIIAAVTGRAGYLSEVTDRWSVPRFILGHHWKSPQELDAILDEAGERA
ncbi:MAG TPA: polysaccharide deacetylase family protein [Usitatibacter sp.]|nr:polysaccharide deacetylase family protein [Usitatibacter sp.]